MRRSWTILIVSARGGAARRISVPDWLVKALRTGGALLLFSVAFVGWHLQALYGLYGPSVVAGGEAPYGMMRTGMFTSLSSSRPTRPRAERWRLAALERARKLGLGDRRAASKLLLGELEPSWIAEAERVDRGDGTLSWPVRDGWYGRGYASGSGGYHLAIDINAGGGTDVLSAAPGIVGYAGRELRGFGNVVLIVHAQGWVTLYGHNRRNLVVAGQRVARGEQIATLGSTGRSMGPHVHFELVHEGLNCDPMPLIAPGPGSYRNFSLGGAPVRWQPGSPRPSAIRCHTRIPHPEHEDEGAPELELAASP